MNTPADLPSRRSRLERILLRSWDYRHLRFWAGLRIVAGTVLVLCGVLALAYGSYGWAAWFLMTAALNLGFGYWELAIARRASA